MDRQLPFSPIHQYAQYQRQFRLMNAEFPRLNVIPTPSLKTVSYTHLDVYKRQNKKSARIRIEILPYSKIIHMIFLNKMLIGIRIFII